MLKRLVSRIVDGSGRHPLLVVAVALLTIAGTWTYAYKTLGLSADLLELLPKDSPGVRAFEHQMGRVGGGAALIAVVESPDRAANEKFVDQLAEILAKNPSPDIAYVETGTKDVRKFFADHKWLYADIDELERAEDEVDHEVAVRSGTVVDLESGSGKPAPGAEVHPEGPTVRFRKYKTELDARAQKLDLFPSGYFATPDGKMMGVRIVSATRGMGDPASERLFANMKDVVAKMDLAKLHPDMKVGWAGEIPNQVEEKDALLSDAAVATGTAFLFIVWGIIVFFRSPWALGVVFVPAFIGVGFAFSFASVVYGYVNATGAFLGAIILGNGINYPIVLLNRYREFRARGMEPEVARREAVLNAFRAELVGALVAGIAYGSLAVTHFRGFNQFGVIGFVGMLLVWISMIPCVPALLVIDEWIQQRLPAFLRDRPVGQSKDFARSEVRDTGNTARGPIMKRIAAMTTRVPVLFLVLAVGVSIWCGSKIKPHVRDPWEYDFSKLGSRGTQQTGAGAWSTKADAVFGGKMNIAGAPLLADKPEQVPLIKRAILENDAKDPQGRVIQNVATVWDFLPGSPEEQQQKLEVLERIRSHLTPTVLASLDADEKALVDDLAPPPDLAAVGPKDLPALIRRRFEENNGTIGTLLYVQPRNDISLSDGHVLLRIAKATDNLVLSDKSTVETAGWWTVYAEIIRSMERDGPLATMTSILMVALVVVFATRSLRGSVTVLASLVCGVIWALGVASWLDMRLNFVNFIALPITFGIGCEYPFNIFDRSRLLHGDVRSAVALSGGAVALCSYTTTIGYSSLLVSDQMALQGFGKLAMLGEIACLIAAIVLLPSLLALLRRRG